MGTLLCRYSEIEYLLLFFIFPVRLTLAEKDEAQRHTALQCQKQVVTT